MNEWFVYIIRGNNNQIYKGFTNNLIKRLHQHELKQNKTTKRMNSFSLVHVEICKTRLEARKLEKFFKSGIGREIIKEII